LDSVRRNLNRGIADLAYFECGHTFPGGTEPHHLAVVVAQGKDRDTWWQVPTPHPFYRIKGLFEALCEQLGWSDLAGATPAPAFLEAGESLGIHYRGNLIGGFGILAKNTLAALDRAQLGITAALAVLELDLSFLYTATPPCPDVRELSVHPGIQQDLAFVLDTTYSFQAVENHLHTLNLPHLDSLRLFDVYEGKSVGKGKKSLGFRFRFQAEDRTLTGEEIARTMSRVIRSVEDTFGATVRV
jgi:phenylalanyl-tRNA synthetase beta chain